MSWDKDADDILTMWRDRLFESDTLKKLFGSSFKLHYPESRLIDGLDDSGNAVKADPLPHAVLYEETLSIEKSAPGESDDAPGNSVSAVFYFDPDKHSIAKVEKQLKQLCRDLVEWETEGLTIIRTSRTRATKPAISQDAGANDAGGLTWRSIAIVAWYS